MNRSVVLNQSGSAPEDNAEALKQVTQFMRRSYAKDSATGKAQWYVEGGSAGKGERY